MKNESFGSNSQEAPPESPDKTDKKDTKSKKRSFIPESIISKKPAAEEQPAKTLFGREKAKDEPEKTADAGEKAAPLEELGEHENAYVQQEIAREHLAQIEESDPETQEQLALSADFLQRVSDGQDAEEAFNDVIVENDINPDELAELEDAEKLENAGEAPDTESTPEAVPQEATEISDDESIDLRTPQPTGGGAGAPPTPPSPPTGSAAGGPPSGSGVAGASRVGYESSSFNLNALPTPAQSFYETRHNSTGPALLAGVLGYLIGRRRGRIKTEKRLLPVQAKLEKQVRSLEQTLEVKERQLVRVKARQEQTKPTIRPEISTARAERMQPSRVETRLKVEKPVRAEQLGHMIMAAEAPKRILERPGNIREAFRAEEVKTMDRRQMLELSEKIIIEGASLRHIYESSLIGERQLRHLVSEYLQGHDIRDELRRHMVEHEIDFERDPIMRDRIRERISAGGGAAGGLTQLLADAGLTKAQVDPNLQRQIEKAEQKRAAEQKRQHRQRIATDVAMATALVTMAVAVIVLALGR